MVGTHIYLYSLSKTDSRFCLCGTIGAPRGRGCMAGNCRAAGVPLRAINSANTTA